MAQDLVVKISAQTKQLSDAFKEAEKKTEALKNGLASTAKTAGLAFAAFTGVIGGSIAAFRTQELAVNQLNASLKNQGIFTEDLSKQYQEQAAALQKLTTFGDEEIISAQARLQNMLGQQEVTEELTKATLDFAAAQQIDLKSASDLIGKSIGSTTNALMRQGVEIDNTLRGQERLDAIVAGLNKKFEGQAEAAASGAGSFLQLKNAVGDLFEEIGRNLVPVLAPLAKGLTEIIEKISANKEIIGFTAKLLLAGAAISATVAGAATLGIGLIKLKALMIALGGATQVLTIGFRTLAGATGVGLLLVAIGYLAANWDESVRLITATTQSFVKAMKDLLMPLGNLLLGIFSFDIDKIKEGVAGAVEAVRGGAKEFSKIRKEQADEELRIEAEKIAAKEAMEAQQSERFKQIQDARAESEIEKIKSQEERRLELEAGFREQQLQREAEHEFAMDNVRAQIKAEDLAAQRAEDLQRERDVQMHGERIAGLNATFRSAEYKATKEGLGNLSTLTASKNKELFAIGKAASIAQAVVNTAEGVTKALAQGGLLGPFLAGSVIAAGAVQIATISNQQLAMAQGGLVEGGIPGVDSVPALLQRGELVAPRENFDEVVNAVARERSGGQAAESSQVVVELRPMGGFMDFIETEIIERRRLGIGLGV